MIDPRTEKGGHAFERLATERIAWLTSVTPDGQPQTMPIWFLWDDGEILIYSRRIARRNRNLRANPKVAFHLPDDGKGDDIISIEGEARFEPEAPPSKDNPAYVAKYQTFLDEYGWSPEYLSQEYPHAVRIRPTALIIE